MLNQVVQRLRNHLHQGELAACYFENDGRKFVSRDFWATAQADGALKSGTYWPFGQPAHWPESRPNHSLAGYGVFVIGGCFQVPLRASSFGQ